MQKKMRKVEQTRGEKRVHFTPLIMQTSILFLKKQFLLLPKLQLGKVPL